MGTTNAFYDINSGSCCQHSAHLSKYTMYNKPSATSNYVILYCRSNFIKICFICLFTNRLILIKTIYFSSFAIRFWFSVCASPITIRRLHLFSPLYIVYVQCTVYIEHWLTGLKPFLYFHFRFTRLPIIIIVVECWIVENLAYYLINKTNICYSHC